MTRILLSFLLAVFLTAHSSAAQEQTAFIQLETHPSLAVTQQAIRDYGAQLEDVNGFSLGAGWYAVALGPYGPEQAENVMIRLRSQGLIPRDSYLATGGDYQQQFWPVGANVLDRLTTLDIEPEDTDTGAEDTGIERDDSGMRPVEIVETPYEARQNERLLSRDERAELQIALQWAGFYQGRVDAAFGRGTRAAMSDWQAANGYKPTGVLTTRQREELFHRYNAVLEGLDLRFVRDDDTGIRMKLPMGVVEFGKYEAPFAHFTPAGDVPEARVLLISQAGERNTLVGLYDIMQTLRMVPENGERGVEGDSFTLVGRNDRIVSHTEASLEDGEVKGFTLVWPAGDEDRRTRLLDEMRESFERIEGVLDPAAGTDEEQNVDLVSGLEIRRPKLSRSGFYVDQAGTVVTTIEAVEGCGRVTIDEDYKAETVATDTDLGIAVLRPVDPLAPIAIAAFQQAPPRLQSDVAVAGYSYGGILGAPTLTYGQLAGASGLSGEKNLKRLALNALEGDAGGPVVDGYGAVVGMLLPARQQDRQLPEGVSLAADAEALTRLLAEIGIAPSSAEGAAAIAPETLSKRASGMTVLVSCWE